MSHIFTLAREASGQPFAFEVDGESLSIPHIGDLDQFELAALFETEDFDAAAFADEASRFLNEWINLQAKFA